MFGVEHMMAELYARGPIACTIAVTLDFGEYKGGIFDDTTHARVRLLLIYPCIFACLHWFIQ